MIANRNRLVRLILVMAVLMVMSQWQDGAPSSMACAQGRRRQ